MITIINAVILSTILIIDNNLSKVFVLVSYTYIAAILSIVFSLYFYCFLQNSKLDIIADIDKINGITQTTALLNEDIDSYVSFVHFAKGFKDREWITQIDDVNENNWLHIILSYNDDLREYSLKLEGLITEINDNFHDSFELWDEVLSQRNKQACFYIICYNYTPIKYIMCLYREIPQLKEELK